MIAVGGIEIPGEVFVGLLLIVVTGVIGFVSWQTKQIIKHGEIMERISTESANHDDRLHRLETWRDGVQFGRAVAEVESKKT